MEPKEEIAFRVDPVDWQQVALERQEEVRKLRLQTANLVGLVNRLEKELATTEIYVGRVRHYLEGAKSYLKQEDIAF